MLKYYAAVGTLALSTTAVDAGGWETGRLDTGFLYQDGSYVEASYGSLDYSVNATSTTFAKHEHGQRSETHECVRKIPNWKF